MNKLGITIAISATLAGCAHKQITVNPIPTKRHHAVHQVVAAPAAPPVVTPTPAPVVQAAPPPVVPPVAAPAPPKHGALRWFLRDRTTNGGK